MICNLNAEGEVTIIVGNRSQDRLDRHRQSEGIGNFACVVAFAGGRYGVVACITQGNGAGHGDVPSLAMLTAPEVTPGPVMLKS